MATSGAGEGITGEIPVNGAPSTSMPRAVVLPRTAAATGNSIGVAEQPGPFHRLPRDRGVQTILGPAAVGPAAAAGTPFRLQVAPGEAIRHAGWRRARVAMLSGLERGENVALLGPPGSGKTLLLRELAWALQREGRPVRLIERGDALDPAAGEGVLLVDEAERTDVGTLARLCATDRAFVLAVLPGSAERLAGLARTITPVALEPLSPQEVARFVAARLSAAGRPRDLLEPDAVLALAQHSAGLPRLVNVLGGAAVFLAELEGEPRVGRRHVDEAAAMREGAEASDPTPPSPEPPTADAVPRMDEAAAICERASDPTPPLPEPPTAGTATHTESPVVSRVPPPAWRRNGIGAAAAVAASLGLMLAGGWAVSEWRPARPQEEARVPQGSGTAGEHPLGEVVSELPETRPGGSNSAVVERPRDDVAASAPAPAEGPPSRRAAQARPAPDDAGVAAHQQPATDGAPIVIAFRGPVFNGTLNRGGQMSLVVTRWGMSSSAITARFEAWGGLLGSGELAGSLSEDGHILVTGQLMMGKNPFNCDLSGRVADGRLAGSAIFIRSGGGRISRSSFALTKS